MKRPLLLFLLFALPVQAGPLKKIVHVVTNHVTLGISTGASSGFASGGTFYCRSHNPSVEHCSEHYGAATQFEVARGIFSLSMIALSEYGRRNKYKEWALPEIGTTAFNVFWGIREFRTHEKVDSSSAALRFKP